MNPRFQTTLCVVVFLLSAAQPVWAQAQVEPKKADPEAKTNVDKGLLEPPKGEKKDPTVPSGKLKELLYPEKSGKLSATGPGPKMPTLELRGRVVLKDQPSVALLEVDGKMFLVGKGSSLPGGYNTILRVIDVTAVEVRIEVLPFREIMILR